MPCDGCDLVRYCSDECQNNHKSEHDEECKKRAAELRDEILFKQPESSHYGDCPICCLPMPFDNTKNTTYQCCSKLICNGCVRANWTSEIEYCPFCREPAPKTLEEAHKLRMKRIEANDPVAMTDYGMDHTGAFDYYGSHAFEYFSKAAELGYAEAHYQLSIFTMNGKMLRMIFITSKKPLLVVIQMLDIFLDVTKKTMVMLKEQ